MKQIKTDRQFAVLGLGRFGIGIVRTLSEYDVNVLACDMNPKKLQKVVDDATQVVQADVTDEDALTALGLGNYDVVILAMGESFEAMIIATMKAKELGVKTVVAKASDLRQKKILEHIGADIVVLPEYEMGKKVAYRLLRPNVVDLLANLSHYQIEEIYPLAEWVSKTVAESDIRKKHGVSLLALIRGDKTIIPVPPTTVLEEKDILVTLSFEDED